MISSKGNGLAEHAACMDGSKIYAIFWYIYVYLACRAVAPNLLENIHFSTERGMRILSCVQVFFLHKNIISAIKRVEFVSDRMSYIILRGRWCHIIVLNVHAPTENKIDDDSFYEELDKFR
jgi:hypothetical protein